MSEKKLFKLLDLGVGSHSGQRQKENIFTQEATPEGERTKTDEFSEKFQKGRGGGRLGICQKFYTTKFSGK